jgi:hypothetical protein
MTFERLSDFCTAAPFVSFDLFLSDGRVIRVNHPDYISLDPLGGSAAVFYETSDLVEVIDLPAIISLRYKQRR